MHGRGRRKSGTREVSGAGVLYSWVADGAGDGLVTRGSWAQGPSSPIGYRNNILYLFQCTYIISLKVDHL